MIKIGETHSDRTIVNIEGIWVKYRYSFGEGECTIDTFERRWVLPKALDSTAQAQADKGGI